MSRPLFYSLLALITGIVIGYYYSIPCHILFFAIFIVLVLLLVSVLKKWTAASFFLIIIFVIIIGIFNIQIQQYLSKTENHIDQYINKGKLNIEGVIISSPVYYIDKTVLIVKCVRIIEDKSYQPVSGNIRLTIPDDSRFQYGDFIRFRSSLKKIQNFQNPGGFDYERYMNLQGIYVAGFIALDSDIILIRPNSASTIRLSLEAFRVHLKNIIYENAPSPQKEIIEAMTIGNQNSIPIDVRDNFNKTGTSHILSISGLHIGMVAATAFFITLFILKRSEYLMLRFNIIKLSSAMACIIVIMYSLIAGMGVTVLRSALMALAFLSALLLGKQKDICNALILAGLIILVISPEGLFDISFQLSFSAVIAIVYIVPSFNKLSFSPETKIPLWGQKIIRHIYLSIIVCIAATIGTLPLIVFYFNRFSTVTIIANLIAVPLLGTIALVFEMAFILCTLFSSMIAGYFIQISSFFVQISVHFISKLADLSWSSFSFTKPNIPEIVAFYFFIFLLLKLIDWRDNTGTKKGYWVRHPLLLKYIIITLLFFFCADAVYLWSKDRFTSNLRITAIDVGQGCATLVRFPGGKNMLVDGGGFADSTFDMGKLVIAPFLYHNRISTIDIVVLSHPHPDHLQGLLYVTDNFDVQEVWITGVGSDDEIYREWERIINRRLIKINYMSAQSPKREINGVDVRVLWPLKSLKINANDQYYDAVNDESMVIKINYGDVSFLLPGDISAYVENLLIKSGQDLQSDVLFAAHHGSAHSSSSEFIRKVSCSNVIFSSGKNNPFRHPHPDTLERFNSADINIFRTDKDGAITMVTDGNTLAVDTYVKSNRPCP